MEMKDIKKLKEMKAIHEELAQTLGEMIDIVDEYDKAEFFDFSAAEKMDKKIKLKVIEYALSIIKLNAIV